jgi:hypothetical protein
MKTMIVCVIALVVASASFAQDKSTAGKQSKEVQQETKTTTANKTAKALPIYGLRQGQDL